jgi:hypothetical protein
MQRLFASCLLVLLPALALGQAKKPSPSALTPQQLRRGEILLFDGETTFGWKISGQARVEQGVLILGGKKETTAEPTLWLAGCAIGFQSDWSGDKPPLIEWNSALVPRFRLTTKEQGRWSEQFSSWRPREAPARRLVRFTVPAGSILRLRNVKALPLGTVALFNGKDLSGWKEIPPRK